MRMSVAAGALLAGAVVMGLMGQGTPNAWGVEGPLPTAQPEPAPELKPAADTNYAPVGPEQEPDRLGRGIQRTMHLLATSTPEHHNRVRILFYGQSITVQEWAQTVTAELKKRYPNADLDIRNLAIGGFASQLLVNSAETDVYTFNPDLIIFHVYGAHNTYEQLIHNMRARTAAEILIDNDHPTTWPPEEAAQNGANRGEWWDLFMNQIFLPKVAEKYHCGFNDLRTPWLAYLKANHLEPKQMLVDGVHLNHHGNYVMAALVNRYLTYRPDLGVPDANLVRTYTVGKDLKWVDGKLTVPFDGNRVDLIAAAHDGTAAPAEILIDGKKPSAFPEMYRPTRATPGPWSPLYLMRMDAEKPRVVEDWTLKVLTVTPGEGRWQRATFTYRVTGSVTGADGEGKSDAKFVSNSGRVVIEPDWFFPGRSALTAGYEIHWKVAPQFEDRYAGAPATDPTREVATTVAQLLPNGHHVLEVIGADGKPAPVAAVRVYDPPLKDAVVTQFVADPGQHEDIKRDAH